MSQDAAAPKLPSPLRIFILFWLLSSLFTLVVSSFAFLFDANVPGYDRLLQSFTWWGLGIGIPFNALISWRIIAPFGRDKHALESGKGIEEVKVVFFVQQGEVLALPVDVHQGRADIPQQRARHRLPVDSRRGAALPREIAGEHECVFFAGQAFFGQ